MNFEENLNLLIDKLGHKTENILTEEATKTSIVMPFIQALEYDIFNPSVVVPEFTADIGRKKGEKVDYAIMQDNKPIILIEVKKIRENLDNHSVQLERYFGTTDVKFAILTNGIEYRFYSDLDKDNVMDKTPFMNIDLENITERDFKALEQFTATKLNIDSLTVIAKKRKHIASIKHLLNEQFNEPSEIFIKFIGSQFETRMGSKQIEEYKLNIKIAINEIINDLSNKRLGIMSTNVEQHEHDIEEEPIDEIITTQDEINGFFIVRAILSEMVEDITSITSRDTRRYFGILVDDNSRKWFCRLHFNTKQLHLGYRIDNKEEEKVPIDKVEDIYKHKEEIKQAYNRSITL